MADEEKNPTDETAETSTAPEAAAAPAAAAEETAAAQEPAADEAVAEPTAEAAAEATPASGADTAADEAAPAVDKPEKKPRSRRHVPRAERRQRSKVKREPTATRKPIVRGESAQPERGRSQERRGVVVSDKGDKTIVVKVDVIKQHPKYKKVIRRTVKFHAHDERNEAGAGDTVRIVETRPLSKTKHWRLAEIVQKAR